MPTTMHQPRTIEHRIHHSQRLHALKRRGISQQREFIKVVKKVLAGLERAACRLDVVVIWGKTSGRAKVGKDVKEDARQIRCRAHLRS